MSEANEKLARQWVDEVWHKGNQAFIHQAMDPQVKVHIEHRIDFTGPDGLRGPWQMLREALPDFHLHIDEMLSQGETVVFRWTATGTHRGALADVPATGAKADFTGITWMRFRNGRMVEAWDRWNSGALLDELREQAKRAPG